MTTENDSNGAAACGIRSTTAEKPPSIQGNVISGGSAHGIRLLSTDQTPTGTSPDLAESIDRLAEACDNPRMPVDLNHVSRVVRLDDLQNLVRAYQSTSILRQGGPGQSLNDWIDRQVAYYKDQLDGSVSGHHTAEIARGAVLLMISNKAALIDNLVNEVHASNVKAGWWTDLHTGEDLHGKRNVGELLALVHSEVSEALEGAEDRVNVLMGVMRKLVLIIAYESHSRDAMLDVHAALSRALEGHRKLKMDDKLPHRPAYRTELIDAVIRLFDMLGADNKEHPAGSIFVEKSEYNARRLDHKPEHRRSTGGKAF